MMTTTFPKTPQQRAEEFIVYFVMSEKCPILLSSKMSQVPSSNCSTKLTHDISSLGAFSLINNFVPVDQSQEHHLKYHDCERLATYDRMYRNNTNAQSQKQHQFQKLLKMDQRPVKAILGTTCVDSHWFSCSTGRLKLQGNGEIETDEGNKEMEVDEEDMNFDKLHINTATKDGSNNSSSTLRLTDIAFQKFLEARGIKDISGRGIHKLANSFLPRCWRLTDTAASHLSRPDSFVKYPLLIFFNVFESMLYLCVSQSVHDDPYSQMDKLFIKEYTESALFLDTNKNLSQRMFFILRMVSMLLNSLISLNSIILKFYPQHTKDLQSTFKYINDGILDLYKGIKDGDGKTLAINNQANCLWVISHLYSCKNHEISIRGCYLESIYGFVVMEILSKLVHQEYVNLVEHLGVNVALNFNEELRNYRFQVDNYTPGITTRNSFVIEATSEKLYEQTFKSYGNFQCRIPDADYRSIMEEGNVKENVLNYIRTKRSTFFNYSILALHADNYRRMTWSVLQDISLSLGQSQLGNLHIQTQLRPIYSLFLTRHLQALLACNNCARNVSKKFAACIRFLDSASAGRTKANGLVEYFRAFSRLPSFKEQTEKLGTKSFTKSLDKLSVELGIETIFHMIMLTDFPKNLRTKFIAQGGGGTTQRLTIKGLGDVKYGDSLMKQMDEDFQSILQNLTPNHMSVFALVMDRVQDVYSFLYVFFLALSQELEYIVSPGGVPIISTDSEAHGVDYSLRKLLVGSPSAPNNKLLMFVDAMGKMGINCQGLKKNEMCEMVDRYPLNRRIMVVDKLPIKKLMEGGGTKEDILLKEVAVGLSTKIDNYDKDANMKLDEHVHNLGGFKWFMYSEKDILHDDAEINKKNVAHQVETIKMVLMSKESVGILYNHCLALSMWAMRNAIRLSNRQSPFPLMYFLENKPTTTITGVEDGFIVTGDIDDDISSKNNNHLLIELVSSTKKVVRALGKEGIDLMIRKYFKAQVISDEYNRILLESTAREASLEKINKMREAIAQGISVFRES